MCSAKEPMRATKLSWTGRCASPLDRVAHKPLVSWHVPIDTAPKEGDASDNERTFKTGCNIDGRADEYLQSLTDQGDQGVSRARNGPASSECFGAIYNHA